MGVVDGMVRDEARDRLAEVVEVAACLGVMEAEELLAEVEIGGRVVCAGAVEVWIVSDSVQDMVLRVPIYHYCGVSPQGEDYDCLECSHY